ncbi:SGNH/GDSL hydrolase family protein [Aeromonas taiwanensis]
MYWPDRGSGVPVEPDRKPVLSAVRQFFTEGGPGVPPTVPGGDWFNQITNELLNVLTAAGIDPSKIDDDQLLQAIQSISTEKTAFTQNGTDALKRTTQDKLREVISLTDFAVGSGVETDELNHAMQEAARIGRSLDVTGSYSVNGTLIDPITTQVPMIGSGDIDGPYRKFVVPEYRAQYVPVNTINPSNHLKQLATTDSPVVVIMGDSISTEGPDAQCSAHSMWSLLTEKLQKDNPQKAFTFHNRAIGGKTWLDANDNNRPAVGQAWWYTANQPWLDYVQALAPDVLFLAFGMNDSNGFNSGALLQCLNKIKAWVKVPDIIFITNPVPAQTTIYPDGSGFGFRGQTFQDGRDFPAAYARNYANYYGHGLIDINRALVAMRDCYDVDAGPLQVISTVSAGFMVASSAAYDFAFRCVCNGAAWAEGQVLTVKAGLGSDDAIFIKKTSGNFVVEGFTAGLNSYVSKATGVPVPAGSFGFEISVIGEVVRLIVAPTSATFADKRVIAEFKIMRHGGIFLPLIQWQVTPSSGPFTSITYLSGYGKAKYKQTMLDSEIWGPSDITPDMKPVWGGNGINHYSARGIDYLVRPVIEVCDFAAPTATSGVHAGGRWIKHPDGSAEYSKKVSLTTPIATELGQMFVQPDPVVDTDFPAIFMSDGASGFVFQSSIHVMSDSANFVWPVSDGSSKLNNAIRYRLASPVPLASATVDVQIIMRGRWK